MRRATLLLLLLAAACSGGCQRDSIRESYPDAPIVLISIDTLRADRLGSYGHTTAVTPRLDALAGEGVRFASAFSHYPLTLPSHASMLTGLLPPRHGVRDNLGFRLAAEVETLAERLRAAGRPTAAAVSSYVLRRATGVAQGFESYDDALVAMGPVDALSEVQRDGGETAERLARWVEVHSDEPFFAFLHLFEPHTPYAPPPKYAGLASAYDGEVAYADAIVGTFLGRLEALGVLERSIIVVTSDHGESLGEHGESAHGFFLYRAAVHVPLIIRLPGRAGAGRLAEAPVGLVDVAATLLDLAGLPTDDLDGVSLRRALAGEPTERRPVYSETLYPRYHFGWSELYAATDGEHRYIRAPRPELYSRRDDPAEENNLVTRRAASAAALESWLDGPVGSGSVPEPGAVSPEARQRLEALGYVGSSASVSDTSELADPKDKIEVFQSFMDALNLHAAGELDAAAEKLRELLEREPRLLDAWSMLGLTLARADRRTEAIEAFDQALRIEPGQAASHIAVARVHLLEGRLDRALEHARVAAEGESAEGYDMLAELEMRAGRFEAAEAAARRAIDTDPSRVNSHYVLGLAAQRAQRFEDALVAYRRTEDARRLRPKTVVLGLHANMGFCLAMLGRPEEAEREYLAELQAIPGSSAGRIGLATLYRSLGRDADARTVLGGLIDAHPRPDADLHRTVIETFVTLGDLDAARLWMARARERFPTDPRFR